MSSTQIIIRQLVNALIGIHSGGVFHRDIKLENVLIETGSTTPRIWIIDFGCATLVSESVNRLQGKAQKTLLSLCRFSSPALSD